MVNSEFFHWKQTPNWPVDVAEPATLHPVYSKSDVPALWLVFRSQLPAASGARNITPLSVASLTLRMCAVTPWTLQLQAALSALQSLKGWSWLA